MRVIVMFDLPTVTAEQRRNYAKFRRELIKNGFVMMQESVYTRMLLTPSSQRTLYQVIRKIKPDEGLVQILTITEKQFSRMEYVLGEYKSDVIENDERLIIL